MRWEIVDDYEALSSRAAQMLLGRLAEDPSAVFGLPTGRTPEGMYRHVVARCSGVRPCFRDASTFNLDEYVGIPPEHAGSFCSYMRRNLFDHVDLSRDRRHIPDGTAKAVRAASPELSPDAALDLECRRYEDAIARSGGLTLTFLGLGRNGHIGFNEPGAPFDSRTRVVRLAGETRTSNAAGFPEGPVPERAITMGIGTILESRSIVLLASGQSKAAVLARLEAQPPSEDLPASALTSHPDVLVIADRAAAHLRG